MSDFVTLDVRPAMAVGQPPFGLIMNALGELAPGQGLLLQVGFEPVPLYKVLAERGYVAAPRQLANGDWEVLFAPETDEQAKIAPDSAGAWPSPTRHIDNRGLPPPEPMQRILEALADLDTGSVLAAVLDREPVFLFPELEQRGHAFRGGFDPGGFYALEIRIGGGTRS